MAMNSGKHRHRNSHATLRENVVVTSFSFYAMVREIVVVTSFSFYATIRESGIVLVFMSHSTWEESYIVWNKRAAEIEFSIQVILLALLSTRVR